MLFKPQHIRMIEKGEKTVTRRLIRPGEQLKYGEIRYTTEQDRKIGFFPSWENMKLKYRVGGVYSIQPGRGKDGVGYIRIVSIRLQSLSEMNQRDYKAEGGYNKEQFIALWETLNGSYRGTMPVWVIEFEYIGVNKKGN